MYSRSLMTSVKDRLPYGARVALGKLDRLLRYSALLVRSAGNGTGKKHCSVCGSELVGFVHDGKLCPFSTSFPRHRALLPLIERWIASAGGDVKLLHVAPDACMRERLIIHGQVEYLGIDRFTPGHYYPPDTIQGDIEDLDLEEGSQDLVICLHVLEHVDNDRKALSELNRVMAPGGVLVLAFPFRNGEMTREDPSIKEPAERAKVFGQWDHVRHFGEDVVERISQAGLQYVKITPQEIWDSTTVERWALIPQEVFFFCRKPGDVSALSRIEPNPET